MSALPVPTWLKQPHPIAHFRPENVAFIPQRRITWRNGYPHLLDYSDRAYPLAQCEELELEHLNGCAIFVSDSGYPFSVYCAESGLYAVSDGCKIRYWRVPDPKPIDAGLVAAQSLATFFDGAIFSEEISCPPI